MCNEWLDRHVQKDCAKSFHFTLVEADYGTRVYRIANEEAIALALNCGACADAAIIGDVTVFGYHLFKVLVIHTSLQY